MKSSIRHEITWLCVPLGFMMGAGAWISHVQSELNAEQRQRESGPSRVRVWGIQVMPGRDKEGYRYGMRVDGHIEGAPLTLSLGKVWILRAKSARISDGKVSRMVRIVNDIEPTDGDNVPRTDVWAVSAVAKNPHEVAAWVYCDSALAHPVLELELEAVPGTLVPRPGKTYLRRFTVSGAPLVAPVEKIPLRAWNQNDHQSNIIKGGY